MLWIWVMSFVALDGLVGLAGGLIPERWLHRYQGPMLGFATGALLGSGLGEILPEALERDGAPALLWAAAAMAVLGTIDWLASRRGEHGARPVVPLALLGSDALHNIGDGMVIAAAFLISVQLGAVTSLAVLVHELPEEVADYALLRASGVSKRMALVGLAGVQLTAGIGAAGTLVASSLIAQAEGVILAIATGSFLYIAVFALLPDLVRRRAASAWIALAIGAAVVLAQR
ncbi:MAG TPA: ZIP family metal transporter [Kofleriaceae bacterium]|nr:ZIP family metal transporter [Kofleriaceae bacterium]